MRSSTRIKRLTSAGMLAAASFILMLLEFPALLPFPWLKISVADVPILVSGFALGPAMGFITVVMRSFLHFLLIHSEPVGHFADIVSSGIFVVIASQIYVYRHSKRGGLQGMITGFMAMTIVMVPMNIYVLIPAYLGDPSFPVGHYIAYGVIPHNLIKGFINTLLAYLLYKRISKHIPHGDKFE